MLHEKQYGETTMTEHDSAMVSLGSRLLLEVASSGGGFFWRLLCPESSCKAVKGAGVIVKGRSSL